MGHVAELYAGYILQAGSRKDFTHYSPRVILLPLGLVPARLAPLSPAILTSVSCSTLPKQGQHYQAVRLPVSEQLLSALEGQHLSASAGVSDT